MGSNPRADTVFSFQCPPIYVTDILGPIQQILNYFWNFTSWREFIKPVSDPQPASTSRTITRFATNIKNGFFSFLRAWFILRRYFYSNDDYEVAVRLVELNMNSHSWDRNGPKFWPTINKAKSDCWYNTFLSLILVLPRLMRWSERSRLHVSTEPNK